MGRGLENAMMILWPAATCAAARARVSALVITHPRRAQSCNGFRIFMSRVGGRPGRRGAQKSWKGPMQSDRQFCRLAFAIFGADDLTIDFRGDGHRAGRAIERKATEPTRRTGKSIPLFCPLLLMHLTYGTARSRSIYDASIFHRVLLVISV